jgi:hypothetical protein
VEKTYQSASWITIKAGTATLVKSRFLPTEKGVTLTNLGFVFYDGQYPPAIANQSPQAASAVRMQVTFKATYGTLTRDKTVNLNNLIYGPH